MPPLRYNKNKLDLIIKGVPYATTISRHPSGRTGSGRHSAEPRGTRHSPHPRRIAGRRGQGRVHRARHRPSAGQPAAGGGAAARHPLRHHLQRCRRVGLGRRPRGRSVQPLFQRERAPHQHPGLPAAQPDAGGDCPRSLCRLRELPRRPAHFLGRIRLHRCPQHCAGRCPGGAEGRHRSVPAQ